MSSWGAERPSDDLVERTGPERPAAHEERWEDKANLNARDRGEADPT